jgi:carbon-monoxide dehydrogenase large subunit
MDYLLPRADDLPAIRVGHHVVPCTTNPLGVKGAGESGVAGALPSAVNAVLDALATRGVAHLDLPMSPARVWAALHGHRGASSERREVGQRDAGSVTTTQPPGPSRAT